MLSYQDIVKIFEEIEIMLIRSLKRNLAGHKQEEKQYGFEWSAWQAEKLKNVNKFRQNNVQIMNRYTDVIDSQTRQIMHDEFAQGMNGVNVPAVENVPDTPAEIIREPQFFGVDETKVNKLMDDITHLEKQAETAALRLTDDVYRQTVNKVQLMMGSGSITLQQAIDSAVKDFLDKGINSIVYRNGRRVNIADYVRMALRTTSTRAALQGKSEKIKALGYDTVVVSHYSMCSPTCQPWQGRVYIDDTFSMWDGEVEERGNGELWGKSDYCGKWFPLLSTAIHGGLFHPNCRHTISLWRDGDPLPEPTDNSENERRYKLEQKQRALEREVRRAKRKVEGFSDPENVRKAKAELKAAQKRLKDFIGQTNQNEGATILKRNTGREKIYGSSAPAQTADVPTAPTTPTAPEGHSVEVTVSEPENPQGAYSDVQIPKKHDNHNYDKVMESRFTENLDDLNNGQKDIIKHRNIEKELEKSEIGKEYKQYLIDNPCKVNIYYKVDVEENHFGEYDGITDTVNIFASNTKTIATTAEVLIHELTHRRYDIGGNFWSECVCRAHELMHRNRRNYLTIAEKRVIIKEVKETYGKLHPNWKWRRKS